MAFTITFENNSTLGAHLRCVMWLNIFYIYATQLRIIFYGILKTFKAPSSHFSSMLFSCVSFLSAPLFNICQLFKDNCISWQKRRYQTFCNNIITIFLKPSQSAGHPFKCSLGRFCAFKIGRASCRERV